MKKAPNHNRGISADPDADPDMGFPSFFDPEDTAHAADLWFQPEGDLLQDGPPQRPRPARPTGGLFDPAEWARAQADLSGELAALCYRFGALDARLGGVGAQGGVRQRLALREAVDLSWWATTHSGGHSGGHSGTHSGGGHIDEERLSLWLGLHAGGGLQDSLALQQVAWAARRLTAPPDFFGASLGSLVDVGSLQRFLGGGDFASEGFGDFDRADAPKATPRNSPGNRPEILLRMPQPTLDAVTDLAELMQSVDHLHPVTQAAVMFHGWCALGPGGAVHIEAGVMAACYGARMSGDFGVKSGSKAPNRAVFMPLTMGGGPSLTRNVAGAPGAQSPGPQSLGGSFAVNRLAVWIQGAAQATLWALRFLDRVQAWQARADAALTHLSGRTPKALSAVLAAWPIVTAPLAQAQTGASRAAVQRNLDLMQRMGLIREITGQGRYRVWTAKI